jgi:hypothetical protein
MRALARGAVLALVLAWGVGCGGSSGLGESCDTSGSLDECDAGLICTRVGDQNTCYQLCTEQEQCAAGWNCNGVPDSNLKSCQPS